MELFHVSARWQSAGCVRLDVVGPRGGSGGCSAGRETNSRGADVASRAFESTRGDDVDGEAGTERGCHSQGRRMRFVHVENKPP